MIPFIIGVYCFANSENAGSIVLHQSESALFIFSRVHSMYPVTFFSATSETLETSLDNASFLKFKSLKMELWRRKIEGNRILLVFVKILNFVTKLRLTKVSVAALISYNLGDY
jgi:hypothetical protein